MTSPVFVGVKLHGINFDLLPEDLPGDRWTRGRNVYFMHGDTHRVEGINPIFPTPLFPVEICWYVDTGAVEWWLYASGGGIGVTNGDGNHYDLTPAGWGPIVNKNYVFSAGDLNTLPFINHPEMRAVLVGCGSGARFRQAAGLAGGVVVPGNEGAQEFFAGDRDRHRHRPGRKPGKLEFEWRIPARCRITGCRQRPNDAGDITFATPGGPMIGGYGLRDQFFVAKENATYAMQYVGGQWVFQSRDVFPSRRACSRPNAASSMSNMIYHADRRRCLHPP